MKLTLELGGTFRIGGPESYQNIKPLVHVEEIEVDGDIEEQVNRAMAAAQLGMRILDEGFETAIINLISTEAGATGVGARVRAVENGLAITKQNINTLLEKVREHEAKLTSPETVEKAVTELKSRAARRADIRGEG